MDHIIVIGVMSDRHLNSIHPFHAYGRASSHSDSSVESVEYIRVRATCIRTTWSHPAQASIPAYPHAHALVHCAAQEPSPNQAACSGVLLMSLQKLGYFAVYVVVMIECTQASFGSVDTAPMRAKTLDLSEIPKAPAAMPRKRRPQGMLVSCSL